MISLNCGNRLAVFFIHSSSANLPNLCRAEGVSRRQPSESCQIRHILGIPRLGGLTPSARQESRVLPTPFVWQSRGALERSARGGMRPKFGLTIRYEILHHLPDVASVDPSP